MTAERSGYQAVVFDMDGVLAEFPLSLLDRALLDGAKLAPTRLKQA